MPIQRCQYQLTDGCDANRLASLLCDREIMFKREPARSVRRIYYDTFDWRLYAKSYELIDEPIDGRHRLTLFDRDRGVGLVTAETPEVPGLAPTLPPGMLRRLAPVIGPRRLLAVAQLRVDEQMLDVLDGNGKTVVRLTAERYGAVNGSAAKGRTPRPRVLVLPVRGYVDDSARICRLLEDAMALQPYAGELLGETLQAQGRRPLDYSAKLDVALAPEDDTGTAARRLFLHLLETIEANEEGVRHDLDVEFLHDLRVAVRRTRALLTHMKSVLPREVLDEFRDEFAWLGRVTGPTRDADVQLLDLPALARMVPSEYRVHFRPLRAAIRSRRESEREVLLGALASPRYHRLKQRWREFLQDSAGAWEDAPEAGRPAIEFARAAIWRRYRKVRDRGSQLVPDSPDESFHELRKECKKLRYLLEFFSSLFPAKCVKRLIKALKRLQDNLGEYQDLSVQVDALAGYGDQLKDDAGCDSRTLLAIGMLVERLEARKQEVHGRFVEVYDRFARKKNRRRFEALFEPQ